MLLQMCAPLTGQAMSTTFRQAGTLLEPQQQELQLINTLSIDQPSNIHHIQVGWRFVGTTSTRAEVDQHPPLRPAKQCPTHSGRLVLCWNYINKGQC